MPLLDAGKPIPDHWTQVADDAPVDAGTDSIVGFIRLKQDDGIPAGHNGKLGVLLPSDTIVEEIEPYLDRLALIAVDFPKFRDGRGFTLARVIRERYGFKGEIRAVGNVLPDQYDYLRRCGVDTVAVPDNADMAAWGKALDLYTVAYQATMTADSPLSLLRRRIQPKT
jgi:uncharacterized protein (DUF934 family)